MIRPNLLALAALAVICGATVPPQAFAQSGQAQSAPPPPDSAPWGPQPSAREQTQDAYQQGVANYQNQQQAYQAAQDHYAAQSEAYADRRDAYEHEHARYLRARDDYDAHYGRGAYARYWRAHSDAYDTRFGPGAFEHDFSDNNDR